MWYTNEKRQAENRCNTFSARELRGFVESIVMVVADFIRQEFEFADSSMVIAIIKIAGRLLCAHPVVKG